MPGYYKNLLAYLSNNSIAITNIPGDNWRRELPRSEWLQISPSVNVVHFTRSTEEERRIIRQAISKK
ncbi:CLUMA_CG009724, isoform A [Clunio marinus]|uniref:CLUMA_CG009724, isoform A n=1 Tax=Clunio marinus TaxID=568069 RepID=A0A1J1ICY5_9DIPT|nr:CLUMA_CG009724, isoform A [Clunio marinus]